MGLFKKRKEPKPEPDAPGVQNVCARCGCSLNAPDSNRIVRIQGKTYCRACASQTLMTAVAPKQTCAMLCGELLQRRPSGSRKPAVKTIV